MLSDQAEPPQQLAAAESHPWYHPYWSPRARVLVNGIERSMVTVADGPGRWIEMAIPVPYDPAMGVGRLAPGLNGNPKTVRIEGDVVIVPKGPPSAG